MENNTNKIMLPARVSVRFFLLCSLMVLLTSCENSFKMSREELLGVLPVICKNRYQARVTCRAANDTLWVYMPYSSGRKGLAGTKIKNDNAFNLEYNIASFNPFRKQDPPELRYISQKVVRLMRDLELRCTQPYTFFVLVVTNIEDPNNTVDEYYMGFIDDLKNYNVGVDFSGEGFSRLSWDLEKIEEQVDLDGNKTSSSYRDIEGTHVNYHDVTMQEFVEKQIKWRIYKRFALEYNTTPFDLTADEKKDAIISIVKTVIMAYNFNEFEKFFFKDSSFLGEDKYFLEYPPEAIKHFTGKGVRRRPAF
ncbi:MAG: hypothetical protein HZB36_07570 [Candidatus Omnitrophica bacterium]|nr:hypothetical protein [Candidatus Omnitrophota bacterium]